MFVVAVEFEIKEGMEAIFLDAVRTQAHNSITKEVACKQFDVCVDPMQPNKFFLYELYDDEEGFAIHRKTEHFAAFQGIVGPCIASKRLMTWTRLAPLASEPTKCQKEG